MKNTIPTPTKNLLYPLIQEAVPAERRIILNRRLNQMAREVISDHESFCPTTPLEQFLNQELPNLTQYGHTGFNAGMMGLKKKDKPN